MESVRHAWRRAACLLFVTGPFKYCPKKAPGMRALLEAHVKGTPPPTTSYLETDPTQQSRREDMELMFVQRHSTSGFMVSLVHSILPFFIVFSSFSQTYMCSLGVYWTRLTAPQTGCRCLVTFDPLSPPWPVPTAFLSTLTFQPRSQEKWRSGYVRSGRCLRRRECFW